MTAADEITIATVYLSASQAADLASQVRDINKGVRVLAWVPGCSVVRSRAGRAVFSTASRLTGHTYEVRVPWVDALTWAAAELRRAS